MAGEVALRFGQRMKQRRLELGLKQREVAAKMGGAVTKQHISDWERGYNEPSDRYKLQLVDALEVPDVGWFFETQDPATTPDVLAAFSGDLDGRLAHIEEQVSEIRTRIVDGGDDGELVAGVAVRLLLAAGWLPPKADEPPEIPPADQQPGSA